MNTQGGVGPASKPVKVSTSAGGFEIHMSQATHWTRRAFAKLLLAPVFAPLLGLVGWKLKPSLAPWDIYEPPILLIYTKDATYAMPARPSDPIAKIAPAMERAGVSPADVTSWGFIHTKPLGGEDEL